MVTQSRKSHSLFPRWKIQHVGGMVQIVRECIQYLRAVGKINHVFNEFDMLAEASKVIELAKLLCKIGVGLRSRLEYSV